MEEKDESQLLKLAKTGDKEATAELARRYSGYAEIMSRSYFLVGGDKEDLQQMGMIGLLRAVRTYDETQNSSFKTYASACIRNAMLDGVREANAKKNNPLNTSFPLDAPGDAGDDSALTETLPSTLANPEEQYLAKEAEQAFFDALSSALGENDLAIIKLYLSSMPYKEISEKLGITAKKVDNTIYNAKKKIEKLLSALDKN